MLPCPGTTDGAIAVIIEVGLATFGEPVRGTWGEFEGSSHKSGNKSSWESVNDEVADGDDDVENVETV